MRHAAGRDKFQPDLKTGDGYTLLTLRGVLDEDNTLARLTSKVKGSVVVLNLEGLERINSCGVRDWVNWLQQITALGIQVVMTRCSPAIINQVNMVTNFAAGAVIHSFFAPYFDPDTEEEKNVLVKTADLVGQYPPRAPEVRSERGTPMEFDDFEESYFAFVTSLDAGDVALDQQTLSLVERVATEAPAQAPPSSSIPYTGDIQSMDNPPPIGTVAQGTPKPVSTFDRTPEPDSMDQPTPLAMPRVHGQSGSGETPNTGGGFGQRSFANAPAPVQSPFETGRSEDNRVGFISSPQDAERAVAHQPPPQWASQAGDDRSITAIVAVLAVALIGVLAVLLWLLLS